MARIVYPRSELKPLPIDWKQATGYVGLIAGVLFLLLVFMGIQYAKLSDQGMQACSATGAAAKLDLSSFVELCRRYAP